jgi:hypothetical protein
LQICFAAAASNRSSDKPGTIQGGLASIAVLELEIRRNSALQMMQLLGIDMMMLVSVVSVWK